MRLIINNRHDDATLTATSEAMPVEYTQRSGRSYVWRSGGLATQVLTATLPGPAYLDAVVLYGHNLSAAATVRIEFVLQGATVHDSGVRYAAELIPLGEWQAGINEWGAINTVELPIRQFNTWTESTLCDSYRITINDATNTDGYMQVSRVFAGLAYSPANGPSYGLRLEWQDFGENHRTEAGSLRTVGEGVARLLSLDLDFLGKAGYVALTRELVRAGKSTDIYLSVYPEEGGIKEAEHAFVARRDNNYAHSHTFFNNWTSALEFQEV